MSNQSSYLGFFDNKITNISRKRLISRKLSSNYQFGRWEKDEHLRFLKSCIKHGNDWVQVEMDIKTRSSPQIRSHAQKFIIHLCKKYSINLSDKTLTPLTKKRLRLNQNNVKEMDICEYQFLEKFNIIKKDANNEIVFNNNFNDLEVNKPKTKFKTKEKDLIFKIEKLNSKTRIEGILKEMIKRNNTILENNLYNYDNVDESVYFVNRWLILNNNYKVSNFFTDLNFENFVSNLNKTLDDAK